MLNHIDNKHTQINLRQDGVVEVLCRDNFTYDVSHIKENHLAIKEIGGGKQVLVLTITGKYSNVTREGRDYIAEGHHSAYVKAEAFILHSLAQKLMASFYMKISKPVVKTAYFSNEADALQWLKAI